MEQLLFCLKEHVMAIHQQSRRYPTILIIEREVLPLNDIFLKEVASVCGLFYVDVNVAFESGDRFFRPGILSRGIFLRWLKQEAQSGGGIVVGHADLALDPIPESDRRAFFKEFLYTECNASDDSTRRLPILLPTRLADRVMLPSKDEGQGYIIDLSDIVEGRNP